MPYVIRSRGVRRATGMLLGAAALVLSLLPATARADSTCPVQGATQPFQEFGDSADYFPVPNGGLELGSTGWELSNARVVEETDPFHVGPESDTRSLAISSGGTAVSPSICVCAAHPTFRFIAYKPEGPGNADLKVSVRYITQRGELQDKQLATYDDQRWEEWKPTPPADLYGKLGVSGSSQTTTAWFVFEVEKRKTATPWYIDDLYFDPYRRR